MLVSEGKTALKRFGFDDSDPLLVWLNAGFHELEDAFAWPFLLVVADITLSAGTSLVTTPADFRKPHSIRNQTVGAKLRYVTISWFEREVDDATSTGPPEVYTMIGEVIQVWPVPTEDTILRTVYQTKLDEMAADGAEMSGPDAFHYPIVQKAAALALQAENEEERAKNADEQFLLAVNRLWGIYSTTEEDEPQQVVDVMGYGN